MSLYYRADARAAIAPVSGFDYSLILLLLLVDIGLMSVSPKLVRSTVSAIARSNCSILYAPVLKEGVWVCRSRQSDIRSCFDRRRSQKLASGEMLPQLIRELYP